MLYGALLMEFIWKMRNKVVHEQSQLKSCKEGLSEYFLNTGCSHQEKAIKWEKNGCKWSKPDQSRIKIN